MGSLRKRTRLAKRLKKINQVFMLNWKIKNLNIKLFSKNFKRLFKVFFSSFKVREDSNHDANGVLSPSTRFISNLRYSSKRGSEKFSDLRLNYYLNYHLFCFVLKIAITKKRYIQSGKVQNEYQAMKLSQCWCSLRVVYIWLANCQSRQSIPVQRANN